MCVDPIVLEQISTVIETDINAPSICMLVDKVVGKGKYDRVVLYTNESHLYLFEAKAFSKGLTYSSMKTWFEMKKIYSPDSQSITISFDDSEYSLCQENALFILTIILQYIHNILTPLEMPEVELDTFDYSILKHSQFSALFRFRALVFCSDLPIPTDVCSQLKKFLSSNHQEIDITQIDPNGDYSQYILDSLQLEPKIKSLVIQTPMKGILWKELGAFVATNTTINSILSYEPLTNEFSDVIEGFKNNPRSKVRKFGILRAKMTRRFNKMISEMVEVRPLETLLIQNSLQGMVAIDFVVLYETDIHLQKLSSLYLDGTQGLDISHLIRVSKRIHTLSISNCGVELSLLFGFLSYELDTQVNTLIISGNKCSKTIKETMEVPAALKCIVCANTTFKGDNLLRIMKILSQISISIDFSYATLDRLSWNRFFSQLETINGVNFTGIGWSANPISLELLDFLDQCTSLAQLKMDEIIDSSDPNFSAIIEFMSKNMIIKSLSINGSDKKYLNASTSPVLLTLIRQNKNILELSINNHRFDDTGLLLLAEALLANRRLVKLQFSLPESPGMHAIPSYFSKLVSRGAPLNQPWFAEEFSELLKKHILKDDTIKKIKDQYEIISKGDANIEIPPETITPVQYEPIKKRIQQKNDSFDDSVPNMEIFNHKDWPIKQGLIPSPSDELFINMMKQKYNLNVLIKTAFSK